jgi:hypothetical protein
MVFLHNVILLGDKMEYTLHPCQDKDDFLNNHVEWNKPHPLPSKNPTYSMIPLYQILVNVPGQPGQYSKYPSQKKLINTVYAIVTESRFGDRERLWKWDL